MKKILNFLKNPIITEIWFCGFNLLYLFMAFIISLITIFEVSNGVNITLILMANLNLFIPVLAFVLYFLNKTYKNFNKVCRLFFGIEMPIIALLVFRLCLLREVTPFFFVVLASIFIAVVVQIIEYMNIKKFKNLKFMVLGYETTVIIGVYALLLSLFFVLPALSQIIISFFTFEWLSELLNWLWETICDIPRFIIEIPTFLLSAIFVLFFGTLFLSPFLTPFISTYIYIKNFVKYTKRIVNKSILVKFAGLYLLLMVICSCQPSETEAIDNMKEFTNAATYEQREDVAKKLIAGKENKYKINLINKYIAKYRYFSDKNCNVIKDLHENEKFGKFMQDAFNFIAYPLFYNGVYNPSEANKLYQELFDENIQFAQKERIKRAVSSTFFPTEAGATLLDRDAKNVLLNNRTTEILLKENNPLAVVRITEEYKNKSDSDKEVYYEFSLPQGSVITDLKLGKNLEYQGIVSTKGAARKTYEAELKRQVDPALLEKAGLRQYTLRVYPVTTRENQKVSYEYITPIYGGKVGLPVYYEKRNVYENKSTKDYYFVNNIGCSKIHNNYIEIDNNLSLPVSVKIGNYYYNMEKISLAPVVKNIKIALLLDTSYSNQTNWKEYLNNDEAYKKLVKENTVDTYFFNDFLSKKVSINQTEQFNIGQTKKLDAINSVGETYDLIVVLTDGSAFDASTRDVSSVITPTYIVHTTEEIPPYFNELTTEIIKTNGDIERSLNDVILDYSIKQNKNVIASDEGYILTKTTNPSGILVNDETYLRFIYSNIIDDKIRREDISNLTVLDNIHKIAKDNGIVTGYSSYIALVNSRQKRVLEENEISDDRYEANLKNGADRFADEGEPVNAVPEPEEWMMIILGLLFLLSIFIRRKYLCKNS